MHTVAEIITWLDRTLDPDRIDDYGPNGLQVDASAHVTRIVTGVTANLAFIHAAASAQAELAVVHHGLYWHGQPATATGPLGRRLRTLFAHNLSLAAYHLPLDGHLELGNAANLARALGLVDLAPAFPARRITTGVTGRFPTPLPAATVTDRLRALAPDGLVFPGGPSTITTVGIVTGGAPRLAEEAARAGLDLFITGEASEYTQATAAECGITTATLGHHRTETFGPRALADALASAFPALITQFIDIDNPA